MSTRSRIAYKTNEGGYLSIYCHFDGRTVINELKAHHEGRPANGILSTTTLVSN